MKRNCPNFSCNFYQKSIFVIKDGNFRRADDSRLIQRFKCKACFRKFSSSTNQLEVYHKKRRVNFPLFKLLASGVSMRRAAIILGVDRMTVKRKLECLGKKARRKNQKLLMHLKKQKVSNLQFDDLVTKENSKLKPLTVSIAVDADRRLILDAQVSQIPAFGHLATVAKKKYGFRQCHHNQGLKKLFRNLKPIVSPTASISSDEHKKYHTFVKSSFPRSNYLQYRSERGCIAGQGELKKVRFDPLFAINHTCALLRANINRLIRKTWCTTKQPERLKDHLDIFICFFNSEILLKRGGLTPFLSSS